MSSFETEPRWSPNEHDESIASEYRAKMQQSVTRLEGLQTRARTLSRLRLISFGAAFLSAVMTLGGTHVLLLWSVAGFALALFLLLVVIQSRLDTQIRDQQATKDYFTQGIARLDGSWKQLPSPPSFIDQSDTLFAQDLDVFGEGSLYHYLCRAQSHSGRSTLARWMKSLPSQKEIHARQQARSELQANPDFLRTLFVAARSQDNKIHSQWLVEYCQGFASPSCAPTRPLRLYAIFSLGLLHLLASAYLSYLAWTGQIIVWAIVALFASAYVWNRIFFRPHLARNEHESARPQLRAIAAALEVIENASFSNPDLQNYQAALLGPSQSHSGQSLSKQSAAANERASQALYRFVRRWDLYQTGKQGVFSILAYPLLWEPVFGEALWYQGLRLSERIAAYFEALGNIEALASLAAYARENPQNRDAILEDEASPKILAKGLRHALLDRDIAVPNPVSIQVGPEAHPQIVVLSGSNMSGKSTYLRSIGLAVVLSRLGAPIPARSFQSCNWRLGACLRSDDSVQKGMSRFYAEIDKLGHCVGELRRLDAAPFLFLFDEIFHGTNSHDRRIAVRGLLAELLQQNCAGWITTHDLALSTIASEYAPRIENQHFEDQFDQKLMSFDYRLRPGVVQKSNALALMRHVGLLSDPLSTDLDPSHNKVSPPTL